MKLTIDEKHNIAYLRFHEKTAHVQTIRISEELNIDLSPDGTIYGIELLNANEQILTEDQGKLVVVNETGGERREMQLR
jgi:uncharacterized protein YuzE